MRAAVLARGLARRMRQADDAAPLGPAQAAAAEGGHKAMMPVGGAGDGRPFLDYVLFSLAEAGYRDIALVIGPEHDAIRRRYATDARPRRLAVTFVTQTEPRGTADAVLACEAWADGGLFTVVNADNLYPQEMLRALGALDRPGLPVFDRDELVRASGFPPERLALFALVEVDDDGHLRRIIEKPGAAAVEAAGPRGRVSMNAWRFDARIFAACRDVAMSARGEFELPQAVGLAVARGVPFAALPASGAVLDLSRRADVNAVSRRLAGVEVSL
jgi:glucose-1-phosphate thymidylyltransferase